MAKQRAKSSSGEEPDRVKQFGALVEVAWFFIASVGMHIRGDECDFDCCVEEAAKARRQAEIYAEASGDLLTWY
jgi:hypothetical protein